MAAKLGKVPVHETVNYRHRIVPLPTSVDTSTTSLTSLASPEAEACTARLQREVELNGVAMSEMVCVVGGCGFVGRSLVLMLVKRGYGRVRCVDIMDESPFEAIKEVEYMKGDLTSLKDITSCIKGAATVIHLASPDPQGLNKEVFERVNVDGTKNIIEACHINGVKRLVYCSSASVVFTNKNIENGDEQIPLPKTNSDAYMDSKARAEQIVLGAHNTSPASRRTASGTLTSLSVRPHSVFGDGDVILSQLDKRGKRGQLKWMIGMGNNVVDFTFVDNVSWGIICGMEALTSPVPPDAPHANTHPQHGKHKYRNSPQIEAQPHKVTEAGGHAHNITNDEPVFFWAFLSQFCGTMGYSHPQFRLPYWFMALVGWLMQLVMGENAPIDLKKVRLAGLSHSYSCEQAKRLLAYSPIVRVRESMTAVCEVMKCDNNNTPRPERPIDKGNTSPITAKGLIGLNRNFDENFDDSTRFETVTKKHNLKGNCSVPFWRNKYLLHSCRLFFVYQLYGLCTAKTHTQYFARLVVMLAVYQVFKVLSNAYTVPHIGGWPVAGVAVSFIQAPLTYSSSMARKCMDIMALNFLGKRIYVMNHPDSASVMFKGTDDEMSQKEVYAITVPAFGKGIIYDASVEIRQQQFHFLAQALSERNMRSFVPVLEEECEEYFGKWGESGTVDDMGMVFAELIIKTASRCLMGNEVKGASLSEVASLYHLIESGITHLGMISPNLPLPAHKRRDEAREELKRIFGKIIVSTREKRISNPLVEEAKTHKGNDVLTSLIGAEYRDGRKLSDDEVTGMLVVLLFAGQHTSSITSTWTLINILLGAKQTLTIPPTSSKKKTDEEDDDDEHVKADTTSPSPTSTTSPSPPSTTSPSSPSTTSPSPPSTTPLKQLPLLHALLEEQASMGNKVGYEELTRKSDLLEACLMETLRMYPPLAFLLRYVKAPRGYLGHIIRPGDVVCCNTATMGRNPDVFDRPDDFAPERWLVNDWDEWRKTCRFVAFGAGRHTCMGRRFAQLQIKSILSYLLRNFTMTPCSPRPRLDEHAMIICPKDDFSIKYKRIRSTPETIVNLWEENADCSVGG